MEGEGENMNGLEKMKLALQRRIQIIDNIFDCDGYKETNGNVWLGPRLMEVRNFLVKLNSEVDKFNAEKTN